MQTRNSRAPIVVDVAVVGSGGAGLAAALEARRAGASVALVEGAASLGGATILSGGGCMVPGTPLQQKQGISDSAELALQDWLKWGEGEADEAWARYYLENSLTELYFWLEGQGVEWANIMPQEGNSAPRWHRPKDQGLEITRALVRGLENDAGVQIFPSTQIKKLLQRDGRVCGLEALQGGEALEFQCKTVVLATGGFTSNLDMVLEHRPDLKGSRILLGGGPDATGEGHVLARALGAKLTHMNEVWFYAYATPDYRDPSGKRGMVFRMRADYLWVNQQGLRFHDESQNGGSTATPALLRQTPRHAWSILDAQTAAMLEVADPYYRNGAQVHRERIQALLDQSPYVRKADTLEELARKMETDVPAFLATIERHNRALDEGLKREPEFGKPLAKSKKIEAPPYYAVQIFPLARKNFGGVVTDLRCRMLDQALAPIAGIYAAGELCGMAGGHINGKAGLEGTMLGPSIFSGRVAGAWAAQEAGFGAGFRAGAARTD